MFNSNNSIGTAEPGDVGGEGGGEEEEGGGEEEEGGGEEEEGGGEEEEGGQTKVCFGRGAYQEYKRKEKKTKPANQSDQSNRHKPEHASDLKANLIWFYQLNL